jgi:hypothetical protein
MDAYRPPQRPGGGRMPPPSLPPLGRTSLIALLLALPLLAAGYVWFVQRVEVQPGEVLVLIKKIGSDLPHDAAVADQILLYPALLERLGEKSGSTRFKGIVYEPLPEGRYFRDPFFWKRLKVPATVIASDEVGIRIRRYGRPLAAGRTIATEPDERGPLAEVLKPGRYNVNPFA